MKKMERNHYIVVNKIQETHDVVTLQLKKDNGMPLLFVPGQFITVYFPEIGTPEGKSYSISSAPHEEYFSITVKDMGEFSHKLSILESGDIIEATQPYGFFFSESKENDMVILAAGIGIAPFRGMILQSFKDNPLRKIMLNYSNRTNADIVFRKELDRLASERKNFRIDYFITREEQNTSISTKDAFIFDHIRPDKIVRGLRNEESPEFFICGSIAFVRDMWRALRENGVSEDIIYTEAFFSH